MNIRPFDRAALLLALVSGLALVALGVRPLVRDAGAPARAGVEASP